MLVCDCGGDHRHEGGGAARHRAGGRTGAEEVTVMKIVVRTVESVKSTQIAPDS